MAEIVKYEGKYEIHLQPHPFALKGVLLEFANDFEFQQRLHRSNKNPDIRVYAFQFPGYSSNHIKEEELKNSKEFLQTFLKLISDLFKRFDIAEEHIDRVLYITMIFDFIGQRIESEQASSFDIASSQVLGKLLLVRFPFISQENIYSHVGHPDEVGMYFEQLFPQLATEYIKNNKLDLNRINHSMWKALKRRIEKANAYKIPLLSKEANISTSFIYFSKRISISLFHSIGKDRPEIALSWLQSEKIIENILSSMVKEEMQKESNLYKIISDKNFENEREDVLYTFLEFDHMAKGPLLKKTSIIIAEYLYEELKFKRSPQSDFIAKEVREFLYPLFLLLGLLPKKLGFYKTSNQMIAAYEDYKLQSNSRKEPFSKTLTYSFKAER